MSLGLLGQCCCDNQVCPNPVIEVPEYENTTEVCNWASPQTPTNIPPYARFISETDSCTGTPNSCGEGCGNGIAWCNPWITDTYSDIPAGGYYDGNSYAATGDTVAITRPDAGFKAVMARKYWHGRFGFTHDDQCCYQQSVDCELCCAEEDHTSLIPDTHYLTRQVTVTIEGILTSNLTSDPRDMTPGAFTLVQSYTANYQHSSSVARLSGRKTVVVSDTEERSATVNGVDWPEGELIHGPEPFGPFVCSGFGTERWQDILASLDVVCGQVVADHNPQCGGPPGIWTPRTPAEVEADFESLCDPFTPPANCTVECTCSFTETTINFDFVYELYQELGGGEDSTATSNVHVEIELSDEYTAAQLIADCKSLLNEWDLGDHSEHPWRGTGINCTFVPLVMRDEFPVQRIPSFEDEVEDPVYYQGGILGQPLPAGYGPHFQWRYILTGDCFGTPYERTIGAFNPTGPPTNSTNWTEWLYADQVKPCAWVKFSNPVLEMQKWGELIPDWMATNWERPCGADGAVIDQTTLVGCAGPGDLRWPDAEPTCADDYPYVAGTGKYLIQTWEYDYRDVGENARLIAQAAQCDCAEWPAPSPIRAVTGALESFTCTEYTKDVCPMVFITPNGDGDVNGTIHAFPNDAALAPLIDWRYGGLWESAVVSAMPDPTWQQDWICPDDIPDPDDVQPFVEPVCSAPTSNLKTHLEAEGIYLNCLSVADQNNGVTTGIVCNPPTAGDCDLPFTHWEAEI